MVSPRNIRLALAFFVISATIGIATAIFQKGSKPTHPPPDSGQLRPNVDLALSKAKLSEVHGNTTVWTIVADRADYDKSGEAVYLTGVRMDFPQNNEEGSIVVTSNKGTYYTKNKNIALRGNVHVTTESGIVFDTETLDYESSASRFRTADNVTFRQQRMTLTARGMDLYTNTDTAQFNSPVQAVVAGKRQ